MDARAIHDAGHETGPPKMARDPSLAIDVLGITHVRRIECLGQGPVRSGDTDDMNVIEHKAVGPDLHTITYFAFLEQIEVALVILAGIEDLLVIIPSLKDKVGVAGDGNTGEAGHGYATAAGHQRAPGRLARMTASATQALMRLNSNLPVGSGGLRQKRRGHCRISATDETERHGLLCPLRSP